jgi:hypothetical protein
VPKEQIVIHVETRQRFRDKFESGENPTGRRFWTHGCARDPLGIRASESALASGVVGVIPGKDVQTLLILVVSPSFDLN